MKIQVLMEQRNMELKPERERAHKRLRTMTREKRLLLPIHETST